jgi:hypothetical protein
MDLGSIFSLNSHFWGGLGKITAFSTLGLSPSAEHLGLSKSTGCRGFAGQRLLSHRACSESVMARTGRL